MISPRYKKALTLLTFIFALAFAFYFALGHISFAAGSIRVCGGTSLDGICQDFDSNVPDFGATQLGDGSVNSISVPSGRSVTFFKGPNYAGTCTYFVPGNYSNQIDDVIQDEFGLSMKVDVADDPNCRRAVRPGTNPIPPSTGGNVDTSGLPGIDLTADRITQIIYGFACWLWSISIFLLIIFIIIAGLRFMYAGANPTKFGEAKTNFKYVILGTIVVMGTFVIISTVAYNIGVDISFIPFNCSSTPEPEPVPTPTPTQTSTPTPISICPNGQQFAQQYNTLYPRSNAPELDALVSCIKSKLPGRDLGSVFTYEVSNELCNYTRGRKATNASCQPQKCSYVVDSCHYGGRTGSTGARSVNFGNESLGSLIIQAANQCGAKPGSRCETSGNQTVACPTSGNSPNIHVHVNTATCDAN